MKKKLNIINLLLPLLVLCTILFAVVYSYEHISHHKPNSTKKEFVNSGKVDFKILKEIEECAVCNFKFSPVPTFTFESFQFYRRSNSAPLIFFFAISYSDYFKGYLFALRGPPIFK
ncbi:hypothetical protein ACFFUQ_19040 [Flavobacterium branchiarum]|uniref:Uncharacterized protein n=1 Tax=Flavobacterium branchiarum TaxID=1114870 RepID=A0ABV5FRY0_9FLAO